MPDVKPLSLSDCRYYGVSFEGYFEGLSGPSSGCNRVMHLRKEHGGQGFQVLNASVRRRASGVQRLPGRDNETSFAVG